MDNGPNTRPPPSPATFRIGAVAAALLVFAAAAVGWLAWRGGDQADWIAKSWHIEAQAAGLLLTLDDAETGQRGYLLTGDRTYLAPYRAALERVHADLVELAASTADRPGRLAAVVALRAPVAEKLAEMSQTIALYAGGRTDDAMALVRGGRGIWLMNELRTRIAAIDAAENRLLARRRRAACATRFWLTIAAVLAALSAVALALLWLRRTRADTAEIAAQARELDRIFTLSGDILAVLGFDGHCRHLSPAWQRITGQTVADGLAQPLIAFIHPDDQQASRDALAAARAGEGESGGASTFTNRIRHADGTWRAIAWHGLVMADERVVYLVGRDVTGEEAREAQLRQAQKMEAVGQLTGGIAHDFNNLLTVITGSLELLIRDLEDAPPRLARRAATAMAGAQRAAALTHQLLAFSRRQPLAPQPVDINRLVSSMSEMLHRTLGEQVAIETVLAAGLWPALADPNQLESAVLNLAVNARDAMPQGGRLTIETANMHLDDAYAASAVEVDPGHYVMIALTDTGTGMTQAVRARVFEPFFTTRPAGEGSGLGLAQVYGFVRQSGGHITIYSEPGEGTAVRLYLPRLAQPPSAAPAPPPDDSAPRGAGELVLLVEDDTAVREFATGVLEDLGYIVVATGTAAEALALLPTLPRVDLLFTDIVLPGGTNGRQLADAAQRLRPGLGVLFTTGYTRNAIIHNGRLDDGVAFIGKPFTLPSLARAVRAALPRKGLSTDGTDKRR